ncbi:MAG: hypothetical protein Q8L35_00910 [Actinomycetota bacterium]|nr:hypothetical protein [Actinomycetota bacterium]
MIRMQDKKSRKMLKAHRFIWVMLVSMIICSALTTVAWAVPEIRKIDTRNVTKFEEPAEVGGQAGAKVGEADLPGKAGAEELKPAWMFPGWQTLFAALAVGYYALMLKFLPKIMAKEEGRH